MVNDLVSVVIPVYNRQDTINRAIDSVLSQTYSNVEVIVVDDGSTDKTVSIVKGYDDCRIKLICQKERGGANKARNVGIASAKGAYIAFQDSDDEWLPDKLSIQIEKMESQGYAACYSPYNLYEDGIMRIEPFYYNNIDKYQTNLRHTLMVHNAVGTPTLVINREVLDLVGDKYFDECMPRLQDYDFVIRIAKCVEIGYINRPLTNRYRTPNSITTDKQALYRAISLLIKKHSDFLDIKQFLKNFIVSNNIMFDADDVLIEGLDIIQEALDDTIYKDIHVKDMVIGYAAKQAKDQRCIEQIQNDYYLSKLRDKNFSIYGAGKVGQELYYKLKMRGLRPKCFIVTACEHRDYIDGIPVIAIDEHHDKEEMILIGISKEKQAELMKNLIERDYREFCVCSL